MEPGQISGAAMAKRLASCNKSSRDRALRLLHSWLPSAAETLTDSDLIKIWKGIFYCVWHADKLPNQLDLANRLSSALETLDFPASIRYLDAFLITIRREWSGIDRLRLDKFYLLIRKFLNRSFALLRKNGWNRDLMESFVTLLKEKSLLSKDNFQANGVNFFIAEVFLEEMEGFFPVVPETLGFLLETFVRVLERSSDRVLVSKIRVNVFEKLVEAGARYLGGDENELGKYALVIGLSDNFLKSASDLETVQGNRKVLFGLRDSFLKLEKDFEKSGLEISFENLGSGSNLVMEKAAGSDDGVSDDRPVKKRKKAKSLSDGVEKKSQAKKKKNQLSDSAVESNGEIIANGGNVVECNGVENTTTTKTKSKKKKNKKSSDSAAECNDEIGDSAVEENGEGNLTGNDDMLTFDEHVISNLQKQFEKVAAEAGMDMPSAPVNGAVKKKRKRDKSVEAKANGVSAVGENGDKSGKKVSFSMKNNLVWKPQTPLPPQSLRLPPSATPRGSALKKGVPAGPVRETPPTTKKIKAKGSSVKKGRKSLKSISPAVKRLRNLQGFSV